MLWICACTCMFMILPAIGQNHSELSQNEIWGLCPRDDLILMLNRVGTVQRILVSEGRISCWQNQSCQEALCRSWLLFSRNKLQRQWTFKSASPQPFHWLWTRGWDHLFLYKWHLVILFAARHSLTLGCMGAPSFSFPPLLSLCISHKDALNLWAV